MRKAVDRGRIKYAVKQAIGTVRQMVMLPEVIWDIALAYVL